LSPLAVKTSWFVLVKVGLHVATSGIFCYISYGSAGISCTNHCRRNNRFGLLEIKCWFNRFTE
jgi:hypothetical protein